jgi:lipoyl(octanoyl) transferase
MQNKRVEFRDLGNIDYKEAWEYQENVHQSVVAVKMQNRDNNSSLGRDKEGQLTPTPNYLLFCEHPHVYTLGKSGQQNHLLLNKKQLEQKGATFYPINRGGDITYHGPGQIVGYPIFDLDNFFNDIHKYLRYLEEAIILTLKDYNIEAGRIDGLTGVWLDCGNAAKERKIAAMGVRCSRWVSMHGFAFNVNSDLNYFNNIVPCGITDKSVTSLANELGRQINMEEVKTKLKKHLSSIFEFEYVKETI